MYLSYEREINFVSNEELLLCEMFKEPSVGA